MYIATSLGQESPFFIDNEPNILRANYDATEHEGTWRFLAKACILDKNFGYLDCDPGVNEVLIEILELCKSPEASQYPECVDQNSEQDSSQMTDPEVEDEG